MGKISSIRDLSWQGCPAPGPTGHGVKDFEVLIGLCLPPAENKTLPRSSSMAAGLERNGRTRVQAIFSHAAGDNSTLLSFKEGDLITLLVPEARDGWHYGESEKTKL